jgi:type II secretory pathway pseudopilin PulG
MSKWRSDKKYRVIFWVAVVLVGILLGNAAMRLFAVLEENARRERALSALRQVTEAVVTYQEAEGDFFPVLEPDESETSSAPDAPREQDAPPE